MVINLPAWSYKKLDYAVQSQGLAIAECRLETEDAVGYSPADLTDSGTIVAYERRYRRCLLSKGYELMEVGRRNVCFWHCDRVTAPFVRATPTGGIPD